MKQLSKLKLQNAVKLGDQEMKSIRGGTSYRCCCGMGYDTSYCFNYVASSWEEAAARMTDICDMSYGMGGCFEN